MPSVGTRQVKQAQADIDYVKHRYVHRSPLEAMTEVARRCGIEGADAETALRHFKTNLNGRALADFKHASYEEIVASFGTDASRIAYVFLVFDVYRWRQYKAWIKQEEPSRAS